jgi:hypothetical protein
LYIGFQIRSFSSQLGKRGIRLFYSSNKFVIFLFSATCKHTQIRRRIIFFAAVLKLLV